MSLNESIVEDAALEWFGELGYAVGHGPHLAPGEPAAERESFGEVVLVERLRAALRRLNGAISEEAREEALRKVLRVGTHFAGISDGFAGFGSNSTKRSCGCLHFRPVGGNITII